MMRKEKDIKDHWFFDLIDWREMKHDIRGPYIPNISEIKRNPNLIIEDYRAVALPSYKDPFLNMFKNSDLN